MDEFGRPTRGDGGPKVDLHLFLLESVHALSNNRIKHRALSNACESLIESDGLFIHHRRNGISTQPCESFGGDCPMLFCQFDCLIAIERWKECPIFSPGGSIKYVK